MDPGIFRKRPRIKADRICCVRQRPRMERFGPVYRSFFCRKTIDKIDTSVYNTKNDTSVEKASKKVNYSDKRRKNKREHY